MKTQVQISIPTPSGAVVSDNALLDRDTGEVFLSAALEKQLFDLGVDLKSATASVLFESNTLHASAYKPQVQPGALWVDLSLAEPEEMRPPGRFSWAYQPLGKGQKALFGGWLQSISVAATGGAVVFFHTTKVWDLLNESNLFALILSAVVTFLVAALIVKGE